MAQAGGSGREARMVVIMAATATGTTTISTIMTPNTSVSPFTGMLP